MDAKITVVLNRPDKGTIAVDSVVQTDYRTVAAKKQVVFPLHHFTEAMWAIGVDLVEIPESVEIPGAVTKNCSDPEWTALNEDAGALVLIEGWLKDELEALAGVGVGNVTIL